MTSLRNPLSMTSVVVVFTDEMTLFPHPASPPVHNGISESGRSPVSGSARDQTMCEPAQMRGVQLAAQRMVRLFLSEYGWSVWTGTPNKGTMIWFFLYKRIYWITYSICHKMLSTIGVYIDDLHLNIIANHVACISKSNKGYYDWIGLYIDDLHLNIIANHVACVIKSCMAEHCNFRWQSIMI